MKPLIPYFEPIAIHLWGNVAIHGFGILVALGMILGARMAQWKAERDGLDPELINRFLGWVVVGVFVGGHLGHALMYDLDKTLADPLYLLKVWDGLSSFGGFTASTILGIWFFRNEDKKVRDENKRRIKDGEPRLQRLNIWGYADVILFGLTVGWMLGRFGCFSAHDHPGTPTDFYLGVYGICPDQPITVACHDMGLYEALLSGMMAIAFVILDRKPRFPGFFTGLFIAIYGPIRFGMDFLRTAEVDVSNRTLGLTPAQFGSVVLTALGIAILVNRRNKTPLRTELSVGTGAGGDDGAGAAPQA